MLTWNQIAEAIAAALGMTARPVQVPSDAIAAVDPDWGAGLLGDKAHSMVFDNAKLRSIVPGWRATIPFEQGAREIVEWYLAHPTRVYGMFGAHRQLSAGRSAGHLVRPQLAADAHRGRRLASCPLGG